MRLYTALRLLERTAPSVPAADHTIIYAKSDGNVYSKSSAGVETIWHPGIDIASRNGSPSLSNYGTLKLKGRNRLIPSVSNPKVAHLPLIPRYTTRNALTFNLPDQTSNAVNVASGNMFAMSPTTTGGGSSSIDELNGARYLQVSSPSGDTFAYGCQQATVIVPLTLQPIFRGRVRFLSTITGIQFWFLQATGFLSGSPVDGNHIYTFGGELGIGIRYDTSAGDTGFVGEVGAGVLSQTINTSLIKTVQANTDYILQCRYDKTAHIAYFSVDDEPEVSLDATYLIPFETAAVRQTVQMKTVVAATRTMDFHSAELTWD